MAELTGLVFRLGVAAPEQQVNHDSGVPVLRGEVKRRPALAVGQVHASPGPDQNPGDAGVPLFGGYVERGELADGFLAVDVGLAAGVQKHLQDARVSSLGGGVQESRAVLFCTGNVCGRTREFKEVYSSFTEKDGERSRERRYLLFSRWIVPGTRLMDGCVKAFFSPEWARESNVDESYMREEKDTEDVLLYDSGTPSCGSKPTSAKYYWYRGAQGTAGKSFCPLLSSCNPRSPQNQEGKKGRRKKRDIQTSARG